jgi:RNA polymerase sigma-70 factor, ECF subfamily
MTDRVSEFERLRPYLLRVAYSHLGSLEDAADVLQEAWLRLEHAKPAEIRDLRAWMTTVVSRLCLDAMRAAPARRETYVGTWLPEPFVERAESDGDPSERISLDESVSMALLVVLESLSPAERCAFLLHDVFGFSFQEVGHVVGRTPEATRQLASRGRRRVEAGRPRYPVSEDEQRRVVEAFIVAARSGDVAALLEVLDPQVVFRSDGGGNVPAAGTTLIGADRVARAAAGAARGRRLDAIAGDLVNVNGAPGLVVDADGVRSVIAFTIDGGRITAIDVVRNPAKLRRAR